MSTLHVRHGGGIVAGSPHVWVGGHYVRPAALTAWDGVQHVNMWAPTVEYDTSFGHSARLGPVASPAAFSWQVTVGEYPYLIVEIVGAWSGATIMNKDATKAVTVDGVGLTYLGGDSSTGSTNAPWLAVFGGKVPQGLRTIVVDLVQSGTSFYGYGASYSYSDAEPAGGLVVSRGSSTSAAVTVPSSAGRMVWSSIVTNGFTLSGFNGTQRWATPASPNNPIAVAGDRRSAGSSTVCSATLSGANAWVAAGLDLKVAA